MKRFSILLLFSFVLFACGKKESEGPFSIKKGTQLIYHVDNGEMQYQFIVDIQKASEKGIEFNWKMTDPVNYSGKVSMTASALKNSNKLFNYFSNQSSETLSDQTAVFISNDLYDEFVKNERAKIDFGTGEEILIRRNELFKGYKVMINGKETELEFYDANNVETNHVLRFTKIGKYPLILEMHIDFSISLKEVKTK
ncbi:MAG: hypothetical protein N2167_04430 [Flavobacteriales bacterium]|nr:hypothetical protein [Flavobacteriales bacterium]